MIDETVDEVEVLGAPLRVRRTGTGPAVLFLHGEDGFLFNQPFLRHLAADFSLIAPEHPGWGSARPRHVRALDDLAYIYLELLESLAEPCTVIGVSLGAWIAAEMATKEQKNMSALVLVSPVGIKTGGREDRAFVDLYASRPDDVTRALYAEPSLAPQPAAFSDEQFLELAIAQEAVTRFAWEPYLHNPQLASRLGRIRVPSLVINGAADTFVLEPDYFATFARLIGDNAGSHSIPGAGHRVEEEAPQQLAQQIATFCGKPQRAEERRETVMDRS
jgi:pimeloyl-ACP methyl ester carboxylesterase